jgi:hypothetical protein
MNRFIYSLIFLISSLPDADKHLGFLNSIVQVTQESVKNIKSGMDNFHSSMIQLSQLGENGGSGGGNSKMAPPPADPPAPAPKFDGGASGGDVEMPVVPPDTVEPAPNSPSE